jgi:Ribbon-helix-helix protein, copG family
MRTTVRIDDDLLRKLKERAYRENVSVSSKLNQAIREGLRADAKPKRKKRFRQKTHDMGPPLIDLTHTNAVIDALEDDEILRKLARGKCRSSIATS